MATEVGVAGSGFPAAETNVVVNDWGHVGEQSGTYTWNIESGQSFVFFYIQADLFLSSSWFCNNESSFWCTLCTLWRHV